MRYLATASSAAARALMSVGVLDCMTTPAQSVRIPEGAQFGCDNGRFGRGWPGEARWWSWLGSTVDRYGTGRCLFAVAPDEPMDAHTTLRMSAPWLPRIRTLHVPAAFVAQDGSEAGLIPWEDVDLLFLGGTTAWKTGPAARWVTQQALDRSIPVHMGRVNSLKRLRLAQDFGCTSADGTFLAFGPDQNLPRLLSWLTAVNTPAGTPLPGL